MRRHVIPDVVQGQELVTMPRTATVAEAARRMNGHGGWSGRTAGSTPRSPTS